MEKATQTEKRDVLGNDTLHTRALADLDGLSGRFAAINKSTVIGAAPAAQYPAAAGPWADPVKVPDEPPLGFAVDDLEPIGERFEVERSEAKLGAVAAPARVASPAVETTAPTPITKRRRL